MTFYRVKEKYDNIYSFRSKYTFIGKELLTKEEVEERDIPAYMLDTIECGEDDYYWSFGCRFAYGRVKEN